MGAEEPQVPSSPIVWSRDRVSSPDCPLPRSTLGVDWSISSCLPDPCISLGTGNGSINICGMALWMNEYVFLCSLFPLLQVLQRRERARKGGGISEKMGQQAAVGACLTCPSSSSE